ncbi:sugar transferase [Ovoidimarina sediminis]|uniref:sugar transferase n=1 Tax=Ovoidimarina sediminis TaxID=3079856 RepID=UPI0029149C0D|nr:sugar transferase [Rhodophyticola sp. MJ-SS7]MDU8945229.1 sugar transferase [Rhodophyticola sp. MJ-SS7]
MKTTSFATRTYTPAIRPRFAGDLAKRLFDITLSAIALLLAFPVMLAIGLAIRLLDGAPVFYVSERMLAPERGFKLLKFRTMHAAKREPRPINRRDMVRVTRLGRCLRRLRLDELPQLLNVLRGEMSLVGPRPPLRAQVEKDPRLYRSLLRQKPGLTGLATLAVHGVETMRLARFRSENEAMEYHRGVLLPRKAFLEQVYSRHRSVALDAAILISTVVRVSAGGGRFRPPRRSRRGLGGFRNAIF